MIKDKHERVELLSPAGDMECLIAALAAGADAVYLGLNRYSARALAANFTEEELLRALDIAHLHDSKIYLTVNTLFRDSEIEELYDILYRPYMGGLDGVIVQDIGVMKYIRDVFPDLSVHASTQAAVTGVDGVRFLQRLGVKRVVPARELSLSEIRKIIDVTGEEIECFIHGSLCYSYSGKCLMSSFIGGRSGNRGRCAQPCRLMYDDAYILSLKDLCTLDLIPDLIGSGIRSFKIEGRMKSKGYVYGVTSIYRRYIDMYYDGTFKVDEGDKKRLISYYTRGGNCEGYYHRHNSTDMITYDSPSYRSEDKDEYDENARDKLKIPVNISCSVSAQCPVFITVEGAGHSVHTVTDIIPQPAVTRPVTSAELAGQLAKCGDTFFTANDIDTVVDDGLFLTKGQMNGIRRAGLDAFYDKLIDGFARHKEIVRPDKDYTKKTFPRFDKEPEIRVSIINTSQLEAAAGTAVDALIIPVGVLAHLNKDVAQLSHKKLYISLPYVVRDDGRAGSPDNIECDVKKCIAAFDIKGAYISNFESVEILERAGFKADIIGDIHMYAYNRPAKQVFESFDIKTTVPVELTSSQLTWRGITGEDLIVYGRLPMMISANCIYSLKNGCRPSDGDGHGFYITDRKGQRPYVHTFCDQCTGVIYNSVKTCITDEAKLFGSIRPSSLRFVFTDETGQETSNILNSYYKQRTKCGATKKVLIDKYTKGHLNRGVD